MKTIYSYEYLVLIGEDWSIQLLRLSKHKIVLLIKIPSIFKFQFTSSIIATDFILIITRIDQNRSLKLTKRIEKCQIKTSSSIKFASILLAYTWTIFHVYDHTSQRGVSTRKTTQRSCTRAIEPPAALQRGGNERSHDLLMNDYATICPGTAAAAAIAIY